LRSCCRLARADDIVLKLPEPRLFAEPQEMYAFKTLPDNSAGKSEGTFFTLNQDGKEKVDWRAKLVNIPVRAIVATKGQCVITLDTWNRIGYEHCLVVYGEKGKVIADFKLEDLLTATEIDRLPHIFGMRWWTDVSITEFEDRSWEDELVIRMKYKGWTKLIRLSLSTGRIINE
jgi:hypothetical protein